MAASISSTTGVNLDILRLDAFPAFVEVGVPFTATLTVKNHSGIDLTVLDLVAYTPTSSSLNGNGSVLCTSHVGLESTLRNRATGTYRFSCLIEDPKGCFGSGHIVQGIRLGLVGNRVELYEPPIDGCSYIEGVTLLVRRWHPVITALDGYRYDSEREVASDESSTVRLQLAGHTDDPENVMGVSVRFLADGVEDEALRITGSAAEFDYGGDYPLSAGANWDIVLRYGDDCEWAEQHLSVDRAFANVHLSGATYTENGMKRQIGGVAFGKFSSVTSTSDASGKGTGLFECAFPARFEQGILGVNNYSLDVEEQVGRWYDGRTIYRQTLRVGSVAVASGTLTTELATVSGVTEVVGLTGRCCIGSTWIALPRIWTTSTGTLSLDFEDGAIRLRTIMSAAAQLDYVVVTIDYLKATGSEPVRITPSSYTGSSTYSSSYPVKNAFDGDPSDAWASKESDTAPYLTITLPGNYTQIAVSVYSRASSGGGAPSHIKASLGSSATSFDAATAVEMDTDGAATTSKLLGKLVLGNTTAYGNVKLEFVKGSKTSYVAIGYITLEGVATD